MTTEPKKRRDPPLRLDMDFAEALRRFVQTDPAEISDKAKLTETGEAGEGAGRALLPKRPPRNRRPDRPATKPKLQK